MTKEEMETKLSKALCTDAGISRIVGQYAGPSIITIKLIAYSPNLKAKKFSNAFSSLMRKQKIKTIDIYRETRSDGTERHIFELTGVPTFSGSHIISHSYYKKIYDFKIENLETNRQVNLIRSIY